VSNKLPPSPLFSWEGLLAIILFIQTLALYKLFTYLLTYLLGVLLSALLAPRANPYTTHYRFNHNSEPILSISVRNYVIVVDSFAYECERLALYI